MWHIDESKILSKQELVTVRADLDRRARRSVNSRQNRTIFLLATGCGLRVSEIAELRLGDVRIAQARPLIEVRNGKGGKRRRVPIWKNPSVQPWLAAWFAERSQQGAGLTDYFVCAQSKAAFGAKLDRRNLRARWISMCRVLGKDRQAGLTIHHGRHTCATALLHAGWPVQEVRDYLGHANISTTNQYAHLAFDEKRVPTDAFAF